MKNNHARLATLRPGQRLQTKALDPAADPILAAIEAHAQKFEAKSAAAALQTKQVTDGLNDTINGLTLELADLKTKAMGGVFSTGPALASPLADFLKSPALEAFRGGANSTGRVSLKSGNIHLLTKAIANTGMAQAGDTVYNVQPERWDGLGNNPQRVLTLIDALPVIHVTTTAFEYMQLNGYANAAAVQTQENTGKAQGSMPTQITTANIATIAHYMRASLQVMSDAPALASQLQNLLGYGCMAKLEQQLINGPGGAGQIEGLLTGATAFVATSTESQDKIGEAIVSLQSAGWHPSTIVLNPTDWGHIQRLRTTQDAYVLGSPSAPIPPSLWGVPVVLSPALAAGTALVFDAQQTALLDRQELVIASSREDATNFTSNQVTMLAELRAGLALFSPGAVLSVALA